MAKPSHPNVVFVITDDQDWHSMWAMRKTRRLIGGRGTTFDHSFISFSLRCPSRATLLTGQYAHNYGVKWNNWPLIQQTFPSLPDDDIDALTAHYRGRMGALLGVDDMVADVVRTLKRTGEYGNTVIVYTSDNGWILGEHRLRDPVTEDGRAAGVKYLPYEGSTRVPLMIAGPGIPRRTVHGVTINTDWAATIADIAGARPAYPADGRSLLPVTRHPRALDDRAVLFETFPNPRAPPTRACAPRATSTPSRTTAKASSSTTAAPLPDSEILVSRTELGLATGRLGKLLGYLPHRWPHWLKPHAVESTAGGSDPSSVATRSPTARWCRRPGTRRGISR